MVRTKANYVPGAYRKVVASRAPRKVLGSSTFVTNSASCSSRKGRTGPGSLGGKRTPLEGGQAWHSGPELGGPDPRWTFFYFFLFSFLPLEFVSFDILTPKFLPCSLRGPCSFSRLG
ncbi:PCNA-associated factor isoform X1 [Peromyscus maniculatus bairdii]|uniref:PCNA-associated factor isoform X1 n=1 Tax=Peromyscus maniculatus bairdii TaxID=230844 RepID=UPI00077D9568